MWKQLWQKWTVDKPAAFGDLLWDVLVVQFAGWLNRLDRLTIRHVITLVLALILLLAYLHRIPVHPGVMLLGDLLAYIDIFSMIFLIGVITRVSAVAYAGRQAIGYVLQVLQQVPVMLSRLDTRHRRTKGTGRPKRLGRADTDEDTAVVHGLAWA